jgi:hypothetical protein
MNLECCELQLATGLIEQCKMKRKNIENWDFGINACDMQDVNLCMSLGFWALNVWSLASYSGSNFNDHSLMNQ